MNFILKPSLEHIALNKIATLLWNQRDIRSLKTEFSNSSFPCVNSIYRSYNISSERKNIWPKTQEQVLKKLAQLILPTSSKDELIGYVQIVGKEISKWIEYHLNFCHFDLDVPNEFCWTSHGRIDNKKTAELLIRVDSIDVFTRYKLACFYCLEDDIPKLWNKMLESQRGFQYSMLDVMLMNDIRECVMKFMVFWTHTITAEDNRLNYGSSTYENLFCFAARCGNKPAVEFFLQKFDLKEEFLLNTAVSVTMHLCGYTAVTGSLNENYNDILRFLVSQMSSHQQLKLFQKHPHTVLYCFLDWPFQNLFVETVKLLWNFIPKRNYYLIFLRIIEREFFGYKDYSYKKMFRDVWQEIPNDDKSFIINEDNTAVMLGMLLRIEDRGNFNIILQHATSMEKNKLIFSDRGHHFCISMIHLEEWDIVKFFVKSLISSKNEMVKFKQEFQERVRTRIALHQINKKAEAKCYWDEFFRILDDFICGYDKRNIDEGEASCSKRICNVEFKDMMHGAHK